MNKNVAVLFECAYILLEPHLALQNGLKALNELIPFQLTSEKTLDSMQAEYIEVFNLGSSSYGTIPYASWWLDGKVMGKSADEINEFYHACGFLPDTENIKLPSDHIGFLLLFVAILFEEEQFEEANLFIQKYLLWIKKLANAVEKVKSKSIFLQIINISIQVLDTLKEESLCIKH